MTLEELNANKESLAALKTQIKELQKDYVSKKYPKVAKANGDMGESEDECEPPKDDYLYWVTDYTLRYLGQLEGAFYKYTWEHQEGHIPKIVGAEKLQGALKALGLDKDYEVRKPVIYASNHKRNR